jgi:3-hydroxyisobutyrate dehydrogenase-like beta-hydroxyacid dehydrogenase
MKIGFVGFGEAASNIAWPFTGRRCYLYAYDVALGMEAHRAKMLSAMEKAGAKICSSARELAEACDLVWAAVPAQYSVSAAKETVEFLQPGTLYADASTATPTEKEEIADMVSQKGGRFVDIALMDAPIKFYHKVPMLISGDGAEEFIARTEACHLNITYINQTPGAATSIKFIRSITSKGLACILLESLQAAQQFGVKTSS